MTDPPLTLGRRGALETAPIVLVSDDPEQYPAETLYRLRPGLAIGVGDASALRLRQPTLQLAPLQREFEKPLPPVPGTPAADDEPLPHQLAENTAQTLLGDTQNAEQLADRHLRMASDEMDDPMMGAPESVLREDRVGLCGEIAIGKEQQLDPLPHLVLGRRGRADK